MYITISPLSYSSSFPFAFFLICSQPKAEAVLTEVLVVKNDIAFGKNYMYQLRSSEKFYECLSKLITNLQYLIIMFIYSKFIIKTTFFV